MPFYTLKINIKVKVLYWIYGWITLPSVLGIWKFHTHNSNIISFISISTLDFACCDYLYLKINVAEPWNYTGLSVINLNVALRRINSFFFFFSKKCDSLSWVQFLSLEKIIIFSIQKDETKSLQTKLVVLRPIDC